MTPPPVDPRALTERRPRLTTLHGHDNRCALCALRVYSLWVSVEPPPTGCSDGLDATPWLCSHVLNSLVMAIIREEMGNEMAEHHRHIERLLGAERFNSILDHIRKHNGPPKAGKMREPDYSRPKMQ